MKTPAILFLLGAMGLAPGAAQAMMHAPSAKASDDAQAGQARPARTKDADRDQASGRKAMSVPVSALRNRQR